MEDIVRKEFIGFVGGRTADSRPLAHTNAEGEFPVKSRKNTAWQTKHFRERAQQRGFRPSDVAILQNFGKSVKGGQLRILRGDDIRRAAKILQSELPEAEYKQAVQRMDHLKGTRMVVGEKEWLVTIYHRKKHLNRWQGKSRGIPQRFRKSRGKAARLF